MTEPTSPPPAPDPLPSSVAAEARLARAYFDYAFDGIIESDAELQIVRANPAAASILGVCFHSEPDASAANRVLA